MRVLITTPSGLGHVLPMVPLARAVQARGHEVLLATAADTRSWVEDAGFPTVSAGVVHADRMPEFWRRNPEARALPAEQIPEVMFPKMFGGVAAPVKLADLLRLARDWEPDLVVHDAAELAGPIAAALGRCVTSPNGLTSRRRPYMRTSTRRTRSTTPYSAGPPQSSPTA